MAATVSDGDAEATVPMVATRKRRRAPWIVAALAVPVLAVVAALTADQFSATRSVESPLLGRPAPAALARTIDGETVDLADYRGRWVLVNFFATWCVPCREEHDDLLRWHIRHERSGDATVIGVIYSDSVEAVRQFREEEGGEWPMLVDDDGRIALEFGVAGVPESFLVDPDGVIVSKVVGGVLEGELESLLQRAKSARR